MWCKDGQQHCSYTTAEVSRPGTDVRTLGSVKPRHMRVRDGIVVWLTLDTPAASKETVEGVDERPPWPELASTVSEDDEPTTRSGLPSWSASDSTSPRASVPPELQVGRAREKAGGSGAAAGSARQHIHCCRLMMRYVQYYRSDALLGSPEAVGEWRLEGEGGGCEPAVPVLHAEDQRGVPQVPLTERRAAGTPPPTATTRSRREMCVIVGVRAKAVSSPEVRALTATGAALAPSIHPPAAYLVRKREMDPSPLLSVATSGYPSPSTSPLTTAIGLEPV